MMMINSSFVIKVVVFCQLLDLLVYSATVDELHAIRQRMMEVPYLNLSFITETFFAKENPPTFFLAQDDQTSFSCRNLYQKQISQYKNNEMGPWPPSETIPQEHLDAFTLNGIINVAKWYFAEKDISTQSVKKWNNELYVKFLTSPNTCGGYFTPVCETAMSKYAKDVIKNRRGLVVGSQSPWAEAALLKHGAKDIVTVEYVFIMNENPQVRTVQPHELAADYLSGQLEPFDFVFTFSSIEHDGLGRYGDPINPFGDMETIARLHCLLPVGGYLFLGVPTGPTDMVLWNAHRIYSRHRLRLILQDWWEIVDFLHVDPIFGAENQNVPLYEESLWILRKKGISSPAATESPMNAFTVNEL